MEIEVVGEGRLDLARLTPAMRHATLLRLHQQRRTITCTCQTPLHLPNPPLLVHVWTHKGVPKTGIRNLPRSKQGGQGIWRRHGFGCPFARHDEGWAAALRRDGWRLATDGTWEATLATAPPPRGTPDGAALVAHQNATLANWATWLLYRARWGRYWPDRARQLPQRLWHAGAEATINGQSVQDLIWVAGGPVPWTIGSRKAQVIWGWGLAPSEQEVIDLFDVITHEPVGATLRVPVALQPTSPSGKWAAGDGLWIIYRPAPRLTAAIAFLPCERISGVPVGSPVEREVLHALAVSHVAFERQLIGHDAEDAPPRLRLMGKPGEPALIIRGDPQYPQASGGPSSVVLHVGRLRSREDLSRWVSDLAAGHI